MKVLALCFVIAVESKSDLEGSEWQNALMKMFFHDISADGIRSIFQGGEQLNFCEGWDGITCEGAIIQEVKYCKFRHGNFNISALPHSTIVVRIQMSSQRFEISTRSLPRRIERIYLDVNQIYGRIDLTTLPKSLEVAYFSKNHISGPIDLTRLPRSLRTLDLSQNKIQQETVWYHDLPVNLQRIRLLESWDGNKITEVCAVNPDSLVKNKQIFDGMRKSRVH